MDSYTELDQIKAQLDRLQAKKGDGELCCKYCFRALDKEEQFYVDVDTQTVVLCVRCMKRINMHVLPDKNQIIEWVMQR